jgi:hypothetical protein
MERYEARNSRVLTTSSGLGKYIEAHKLASSPHFGYFDGGTLPNFNDVALASGAWDLQQQQRKLLMPRRMLCIAMPTMEVESRGFGQGGR